MISRDRYLSKLNAFIDQPELIKIIVGIRRCGKSVMLQLIQDELLKRDVPAEHFITLNFEKMSLSELRNPENLYTYLTNKLSEHTGRSYIFLDEIQEVDDWERCISSIRVEYDADIYLTGSNATLFSGEYATLIAGRYVHLHMQPFSFAEYLAAKTQHDPTVEIPKAFNDYITEGSMPFVAALGITGENAESYLKDIYQSVVIKDIVQRNDIRNVDVLERILTYVFANVGQTFSAHSISKYFKNEKRTVAPDTVLNYLKAAQNAFLLYKAERYDIPSKRLLKVDEKYYVADHGMREAIFGNNHRDIERVLENIVYLELRARGWDVRVGRVGEREIDFVCSKGADCIYVQVSYLLTNEETRSREFDVYRAVRDNYPKYVLSMDEVDFSRDGVLHLNIRDFLLD